MAAFGAWGRWGRVAGVGFVLRCAPRAPGEALGEVRVPGPGLSGFRARSEERL